MISIRSNVTELERCCNARDLALDCYQSALVNVAEYAVELDADVTASHRRYIQGLAANIASGEAAALEESRASLRGLLRDYRDKASEYLSGLRDELTGTADALQQILDALGQTEGDHDSQLRGALTQLQSIPSPVGSPIRDTILAAAKTIEHSLEQVRKQHQLTVSQFLMEIRMLHKRIDALESAATIDNLTKLFAREEMENRIRGLQAAPFNLLLVKTHGLRVAEGQFGREVSNELAGAFTKRLRNSLPPGTLIGRWSEEEFIAVLHGEYAEASTAIKRLSSNLAGAYACLKGGKTVRPTINLRVGLVDRGSDSTEKVLQRVKDFLNARA